MTKKILGEKKYSVKKNSVIKNFVKKISVKKNFVKKISWSKKFFQRKKIWSNKIPGQKHSG